MLPGGEQSIRVVKNGYTKILYYIIKKIYMKSGLDIGDLHRNLPSLDALLALMAFEKEGDLVGAANSMQLTQPAISFQLKRLEESLGFQIFSTSGKRKVLTKLGQVYAEEVRKRQEVARVWLVGE